MRKRVLAVCFAAFVLAGCTGADLVRHFGRKDRIAVVAVASDEKGSVAGLSVTIVGFVPAVPMVKKHVLAEGITDVYGRFETNVPAHFEYEITVGNISTLLLAESGFFGDRQISRKDLPENDSVVVEVEWRDAYTLLKRDKSAEPGATDNPDDAQRLREDH